MQIVNAREYIEKREAFHCWWKCKLVQPLWRTVWRLLEKIKIELPYDPAIPLLGIYPGETLAWKDARTPMFTVALFTTAKTRKQPKCPLTEEWIKKMWCTYTMLWGFFCFIGLFFVFWAVLHSLQKLSSLTKDGTQVLGSESTGSSSLECREIPSLTVFYITSLTRIHQANVNNTV